MPDRAVTPPTDPPAAQRRGRAYIGTSGFAYPDWSPRFYPTGLKGDALLAHYASRLTAVELNNTFYQSPSASKVAAWIAASPPDFRFSVKAQRLGTVLFRVPDNVRRDDDRLAAMLHAWPRDLPLTVEFADPSWRADETVELLARADAVLCATEGPDDEAPPTLIRTGRFLYLRLRRHDYPADELAAWRDRLQPFLAAGDDAFVFFRHDDTGRGAELALELQELLDQAF